MSETLSAMPPCNFFDGFPLPAMYPVEQVNSIINYKPRDDDLFIVTFPKCGTTWSQHIMALILRQGEPFGEDFNLMDSGPFLEITGMEMASQFPKPCAFRTHLPFRLTPWSDKAKYIYVTRNPKDTCVSAFHHMKNMPGFTFKGTFGDFFEHFISGDIACGDFFDHLEGWYEQRNRPNVLFVTYEEMKEDPEAAVLKMASFVDEEKYAKPLREDRQKLEKVLKYSSFKEMKVTVNKSMDEFVGLGKKDVDISKMPEGMQAIVSEMQKHKPTEKAPDGGPKSTNFVRKGIIGDWRNHFSEKQSRRMDEKFAERMKNIEFAKLWEKYIY